ncbi:MAG: glycine cleavage system aminomethyltransferase GcvT, partial [Syntrophales bacterium]|nr:glycine cleavage system aminomethyltransferase GcvT [Syntrophales bacterium]
NVIDEHNLTRNGAGLFDICHMGEIEIQGPGAFDFLQLALSRNLSDQRPLQMKLSLLVNEHGGIIDDLTVYLFDDGHYRLVTNAVTKDKDLEWLRKIKGERGFTDVEITDISDQTGKLDLQGPRSEEILQQLVPDSLRPLKYYHAMITEAYGIPAVVSRSGYTGEDGFEIYTAADRIGDLWDKLLRIGIDYGLKPAGLGARDTLRLEAGMMLYGSEMDETVTPFEVVYGWVTNLEKDFIGRDALLKLKTEGLRRKLVGFTMWERGIARHGYKVFKDDAEVGIVTSGSFVPTLEKAIGLAFVPSSCGEPGTTIDIQIRNHFATAQVVSLPFYKRKKQYTLSNILD